MRHGPTHEKRVIGWEDVPADLSDAGTIAALRRALPDQATVFSSDLQRAHRTARAIVPATTDLEISPSLREMNFGAWEGLTASEIEARDPDLSRRFWTGDASLRPPRGESWNDVSARVDRFQEHALTGPGPFIVVAHMGVIMTRIQQATGGTVHEAMGHTIPPFSLTCIEFSPRGQRLVFSGRHPTMVNTS